MFPQSFFFYLCKNYSFLRNGIIIKFRTRKILCTNETKTIVQRVVPRKLSRTRVDRSRRISIRKYKRKYTIRRANDRSRCERAPIERIRFILSPVIQLFGLGSKVQWHTRKMERGGISQSFTAICYFARTTASSVLFPETRSLLSLRIGPITKIQNTKYIILIINFFL